MMNFMKVKHPAKIMDEQIVSAKISGSLVSLHDVNGIAWHQVSPPGPGQPQSAVVNGDVLVVHMSDGRMITYQKQRSGSFTMQSIR